MKQTTTQTQDKPQSFKEALKEVVNYNIYIIAWSENIQNIKVLARVKNYHTAYKSLEMFKENHPDKDLRIMQEVRKYDI